LKQYFIISIIGLLLVTAATGCKSNENTDSIFSGDSLGVAVFYNNSPVADNSDVNLAVARGAKLAAGVFSDAGTYSIALSFAGRRDWTQESCVAPAEDWLRRKQISAVILAPGTELHSKLKVFLSKRMIPIIYLGDSDIKNYENNEIFMGGEAKSSSAVMAKFLANYMKYENIVVLGRINSLQARQEATFLRKRFNQENPKGQVVELRFSQTTRQFGDKIKIIERMQPQATCLVGDDAALLGKFAAEALQAGTSQNLVLGSAVDMAVFAKAAGQASDQCYVIRAYDGTMSLTRLSNLFNESYAMVFESKPGKLEGLAFDAFMIIREGCLTKGSIASNDLLDYLHNLEGYSGASGIYANDGKNALLRSMLVVKHVHDLPEEVVAVIDP
jgi:hypothetical protein